MIVEYKLLKRLGETARQGIIELKRSGYKTEPAFAKLLRITGDPYDERSRYIIGRRIDLTPILNLIWTRRMDMSDKQR